MKTLIFCTAYARTPSVWTTRYRLWLRAVAPLVLDGDQILLVDDGSETLPGWPELAIRSGNDLADAGLLPRHRGPLLFHFAERLGRTQIYDFPGWHRSFVFAARYAEAHGFDRVIHLESDAHLTSARAHDFFRDFRDGWAALWCPRYNFPEIAFQLVAGQSLRVLAEFARRPYADLRQVVHETALPLTHVERSLTGDRYGEDQDDIPADADYAAQVQPFREPSYYWWLNGPARSNDPIIDWSFGKTGNLTAPIGDGWAQPEANHRWMLGLQSVIALPPLPPDSDFRIVMTLMPHVRPVLPRQRLIAFVNETAIGEYEVTGTSPVGFVVPSKALRRDGTDKLRMVHPDGISPQKISGVADRRWLSLGLIRMKVFPL